MPNRRQIREAVVQFLYAADPSEPLFPDVPASPALELLLEPLHARLTLARAKALVHLQQSRDRFIPAYRELVLRLAHLELGDHDNALPAVHDLLKSETEIHHDLDLLQRELHGNKDPERLGTLLQTIRLANLHSRAAVARLHASRPDFPALDSVREDAMTLTAHLPLLSERVGQVLDPEPPALPELKAVRRAAEAIPALRQAATTILEGLAKNLPDLDQRINSCLENYRPGRIDRVDRAILRLATFELLHCPEVPPAVAIDEAIELARAFGTTDSPRFVNGVLDKVRQQASSSGGIL